MSVKLQWERGACGAFFTMYVIIQADSVQIGEVGKLPSRI